MPIGPDIIILLLASVQGLFLTVLLFHKYRALFANRFLITLIFLYSIILIHLLIHEIGYDYQQSKLILFILGIAFLAGPLHYLYTKYLVYHSKKFDKKDWLHFLACILYEFLVLVNLFAFKGQQIVSFPKGDIVGIPVGFIIFNWLILLHVSIYMVLTIIILNRYARYIKGIFSNIDKIKLDWLRYITYMAAAFVTIFFVENLLLILEIDLSGHFDLTSILTALYIYALGYMGLFKSEVFMAPEIAKSISHLPEYSFRSRQDLKDLNAKSGKYEKSGLSQDTSKMYLDKLLRLMQNEEPYTNSDLTLNQLAEMLSISTHNLSEVINTQLKRNFFDFINQYRVEKVKKALVNANKQHLKIIILAFEAGFNSKSSFNHIFKKYTNLTPTQYRQQAAKNT